jgi:2,4-dienoyl-CoA reductase-like NADH-dependent reductase (Old Yellow Enzyme family)
MSRLFDDINICGMRLKNRMVIPALGTWLANEDGTVSE